MSREHFAPSLVHVIEERAMKDLVGRFIRDESGATAIEYGIIASGVAAAIVMAVNSLGTQVNVKFNSVANSLR
jgi:pilus assembly protein Flp/PilA